MKKIAHILKLNHLHGGEVTSWGRSILWGRQSYRWSDFDFEANAKEGVAIDWPIRYKELAPWYDYVETFAGISGSKRRVTTFTRRSIFANGFKYCGERRGRTN